MLFLTCGMLLYGLDTNSKISARLKYCQGDSLNLMKHLCKTAGSISRGISITEVFSDKKMTVD